jgi:AcrR family transcriptional regulator
MPRPRSDIAPRILRAARRRFLADGVDGASLRRIAADARTNIGMIYYYFKTKEDLFLAVVEEQYAKLLGEMVATGASPEERVRAVFARMGRLSDDELDTVRLIMREVLSSAARRKQLLQRFLRGHIPVLFANVIEGQRRGDFTTRQPPFVLAIATGMLAIFPQVLRRLAAGEVPPELGIPDGEALATALCDVLLGGISSGPRP